MDKVLIPAFEGTLKGQRAMTVKKWDDLFRQWWNELMEKPESELPEWAVRIKRNKERRLKDEQRK